MSFTHTKAFKKRHLYGSLRRTAGRIRLYICLLCASIVLHTTPLSSDTLKIPDLKNESSQERQIARPVRSMTMDEVRSQFGNPLQEIAAVGDPPISRWIYPNFVVHFEYNYVIHSVLTKKKPK